MSDTVACATDGADTVVVIDTGTGNLRSVEKALAKVGGRPVVTSDPEVVRRAARVVVPGQGAFGSFVAGLREHNLEEALREFIATGRPYLGICLGLQVLFDSSEEYGPIAGLGLIPGRVVRFEPTAADPAVKVPHMGWNQVTQRLTPKHGREPLLAGIEAGAHFYFIHSYYVVPQDSDIVSLSCSYPAARGGAFAAAVHKDNLFACQFHPEKSSTVGLKLLENFVEAP